MRSSGHTQSFSNQRNPGGFRSGDESYIGAAGICVPSSLHDCEPQTGAQQDAMTLLGRSIF